MAEHIPRRIMYVCLNAFVKTAVRLLLMSFRTASYRTEKNTAHQSVQGAVPEIKNVLQCQNKYRHRTSEPYTLIWKVVYSPPLSLLITHALEQYKPKIFV